MADKGKHFPLESALESSPSPGNLATEVAKFRNIDVEFYQPKGRDDQEPHDRDELYVVARGSGVFELAGDHRPFTAGDVIYVPAHAEHRFVQFGDDFATWVFFL